MRIEGPISEQGRAGTRLNFDEAFSGSNFEAVTAMMTVMLEGIKKGQDPDVFVLKVRTTFAMEQGTALSAAAFYVAAVDLEANPVYWRQRIEESLEKEGKN